MPVYALAVTVGARHLGGKPAFGNRRCAQAGFKHREFGGNGRKLTRRQYPQLGNDMLKVGFSHSWPLDSSALLRQCIQSPLLQTHQMRYSTAFANRANRIARLTQPYTSTLLCPPARRLTWIRVPIRSFISCTWEITPTFLPCAWRLFPIPHFILTERCKSRIHGCLLISRLGGSLSIGYCHLYGNRF